MTEKKLKKLFKFYDSFLKSKNINIEEQHLGFMRIANLEHVRWMCNKAPDFIETGRINKAMRWLGFVQGILFSQGYFSIKELKEHSRKIEIKK